jgi:Fe-S oxidoreductase
MTEKRRFRFEELFRDQVLRCSSCGFCQAVCPVFGLTLRPSYNARGKMLVLKEVMDGTVPLSDELIETLFQCTTCGICAKNCPSGVNPPEIIKAARRDMVAAGSCHPAFRGMKDVLSGFPNIYGEVEAPDFGRELGRKAQYVYFVGCVGAFREDEATEETLELLDLLKVDYTLVEEACCSGVLEDLGFDMNMDLSRRNIEAILATGAKKVITGCPYCLRTFTGKEAYATLRDAGIEFMHLSQFLSRIDPGVKTDKVVTYHDPCDLGRHMGIYEEPRKAIQKIAPNFVEMAHNRAMSLCCGAGGGVRGAFPANSIGMARRRLQEAEEAGAEVLLTECNSCVHNLRNGKLRSQKLKIYTTAQFLRSLLKNTL